MLYILIPTYNEEDNISSLSITLKELVRDIEYLIIIVDDCSADLTVQNIRQELDGYNLTVIKKDANKGPGDSFRIGFLEILALSRNDQDRVLTFEADNTVALNDLKLLLKISSLNFNLVLASPYAQGGGFQQTNFFRKILSFTANILMRALFNVKVLTLSSFVRVYETSLLRTIYSRYPKFIESTGFFSMAEITFKAIKCEATIIEVPVIIHSQKRIGKSKMKIIKTSIEYIRMLIKIRI